MNQSFKNKCDLDSSVRARSIFNIQYAICNAPTMRKQADSIPIRSCFSHHTHSLSRLVPWVVPKLRNGDHDHFSLPRCNLFLSHLV